MLKCPFSLRELLNSRCPRDRWSWLMSNGNLCDYFNFCRFSAFDYTTLDELRAVFTARLSAQAPSAHQPWLFATQLQNTAVQCGLDAATQISSTPNFIVQWALFQAACKPCSSHGCQCSAMLHLLLYAVKWQLTICFKSSKPVQIGQCVLMSLSIHLHGLHLD